VVAIDLLVDLNEEQRRAVTAPLGANLVLAGPGSGKTRVLTARVAYLVREHGISPRSILAVTFTNKAAREMVERLRRILGSEVAELTMGTFHSVCTRILRREARHVGIPETFVIYDQNDQLEVLRAVLKELNLDPRRYSPLALASAISRAKSEMLGPSDITRSSYWEEIVARAYQRYQELLGQADALDFDDLLIYTLRLFRDHEAVASRYRARYRHILVDEFQDTNLPQYELIRLLAWPDGDLFAVGDEDQSIYRWRGADYRNLVRLRECFPDLRTYLLETNYRSTHTIVEASAAVIARNRGRVPKKLRAVVPGGEPVQVRKAGSPEEEAEFVVGEIRRLVEQEGFQLGDFAVMYRMNAQSRALEEAFVRHGMPYRLVGGTRFYQRREVKDVLAYLRLLLGEGDWLSFERVANVPARGIGEATLQKLRQLSADASLSPLTLLRKVTADPAAREALGSRMLRPLERFLGVWDQILSRLPSLTVAEAIDAVLNDFGYAVHLHQGGPEAEERLQNIAELRAVAAEHFSDRGAPALAAFLDEVALVADIDELEDRVEAPVLLTLHMAKGLEFPVVFIVGLQEGILPHSRSLDDPEQLAEERRLFYVGMTRAQRKLYLLYSGRGRAWQEGGYAEPSRFLRDLPVEVVSTTERASPRRRRHGELQAQPLSAQPLAPEASFFPGELVTHPHFGRGTVVEVKPAGRADLELVVAFDEVGIKRLLASLARLQKI
jgi:DNA helicase-2/ATP-dependent DNA helicase PcrA